MHHMTRTTPELPTPRRMVVAYLACWVPLGGLYVAVLMATGYGPLAAAIAGALNNVLPAAALGWGVWWLSGVVPWPDSRARALAAFLGAHVTFALVYSALWVALLWGSWALYSGTARASVDIGRFLGWQLLSGLWLYGIVAGVSYAVRTARAAREQQHALVAAEGARARAELAVLRAHLSPHFVFNMLHSLTGMVRDDPRGAEQALRRFGDLLHYVLRLDREGRELVALEEEWDCVRAFLELEQLRFGDRLRVVDDVDADALGCLVPPFVLQPCVENAVRHGVSARRAGVTVRIAATVDETGWLRLSVADDGPGADPAAVDQARGLGIRAVRERLAAAAESPGEMTIATAPGAGFAVTLRVPARVRAVRAAARRAGRHE
jgi:signal transduction histidine kinase